MVIAMKKKRKNSRLSDSFRCAWAGIAACTAGERNMKLHLATAFAVTAAGILLNISKTEWLVCLLFFALVIGAELMNTAIEALVDLVCPREDPKAKLAKDAAAGAVLVCAVFSAIAGLRIFLPRLAALFL